MRSTSMQRYRDNMYRDSFITSVYHGREDLEVRNILNGSGGGDREEQAGRSRDADSSEDERGDGGTHDDREDDLEADGGAQAEECRA